MENGKAGRGDRMGKKGTRNRNTENEI